MHTHNHKGSALTAIVIAVTALSMTSCKATPLTLPSARSHSTGGHAPTTGTIVTGPGPQSHYTTQTQPTAGTCHYRDLDVTTGSVLPDPHCTPGAVSPAVTPTTIATTICRTGYTKTVRPPTSVTTPEKEANARSYAYNGKWKIAEYDHYIPLELGGDPNDRRNLWVEPNKSTATHVQNPKDGVEDRLKHAVCDGTVGLRAAQKAIATNWTTAEHAVGIK